MIPGQEISFKILQTACFHFFTFTRKSWLIDWLIEGFEMNNDSRGKENSFNLRLCKLDSALNSFPL